MELTGSTRPTQTLVDLNDSPLPSQSPPNLDALSVVRSFHETLAPPLPANLPYVPAVSTCSACALPAENVLVCDGCELGFHIGCAEMPGKKEAVLGEWRCGKCVRNAVACNRWPLGVKTETKVYRRRNPGKAALRPPRAPDDDDDEGETLSGSREHSVGDNSLGGNSFGVSVTNPKLSSVGSRPGFRKASGIMSQSIKSGSEDQFQNKESQIQNIKEIDRCALSEGLKSESEDIFQHKESQIQSIKEFDGSLSEGLKSGSEDLFHCKGSQIPNIKDLDGYAHSKGIKKRRLSSTNMSPDKTRKMYLESLREYIRESCGSILEEGWRVEFRNSMGQEELNVVYCAPDGKTCESMSEVASYLGISPNVNGAKDIVTDSSPGRVLFPKRRKSARLYVTNGVAAKKESVMKDFVKDQLSDIQPINSVGDCLSGIEELNDEFPIQYEDFFILSPGIIDARPSYHIADQIWPIGYKSCWHDKVTGSLFICEVLDGGDSGPIFKIKRSSCSALPIPIGSTVLCELNADEPDIQKEGNSFSGNYNDEDFSILGMLLEPSQPKELKTLSCFGSNTFDCPSGEALKGFLLEANSHDEKSKSILSNNMWADGIGEFSVQEFSSSLAWRMMSQKLTNACRETYMQTGHLEFCCKHAADATGSFYLERTKQRFDEKDGPLVKFCGSSELVNIPSIIHDRRELEIYSEILFRWLDQDRFGLDIEFVQEVLELLPGATSCPCYVFLKERTAYSSSLTVGNGLLVAKTNDGGDPTNEKLSDESSELFHQAKIQKFKYSLMDKHVIPLGKPISSALPPQLLSDALQVWEYLCRFHDVLELSEPSSFEELEKELISPWFDSLDLEKFRRKPQECLDSTLHTDGTSCHSLSPNIESGPAVPEENPHAFIPIGTGKINEAAEAKLASVTYSRCNGFALTKIHKSLTRVLVSELQSKVAAVIDPTFDTGESISKRGWKKDTNYWIAAIRTKINILPLNELTWPELVRRYILAVLSMDGRLDSADTISLESGKVFRCLQGDGGVLCGSLTGVAGIEADTLLLAEATQNIFGSLNNEHDTLAVDDVESNDSIDKKLVVEGVATPEWAKVLEPVRKLPTNVGARIRKCVYEALEKDPPEWAKKVLQHSISKGVYKGNASGPTKKAVLAVLADLSTPGLLQKPDKEQKKQRLLSISDIVMKQCRAVLRHLAAADTEKNFCNLLGRKFIDCSDSDDEGLLGSPTMLSRPLDFRTIDLKLATGAYGGSHEAFRDDVREFWTNVRIAYKDQPDLIQLAEMLAHNFESMYEKEVLTLFLKLVKYSKSKFLSTHSKDEIDHLLASACEIPKAPWEGVCKVCGIDRDDDNVLLCDKCDAEYHKYCLNPPLATIPEGNWFCPSCVAGRHVVQEESDTCSIFDRHKRCRGEFTRLHLDSVAQVAAVMEEREYWELGVVERTFLLKFLFEELLSSVLIRQHLEQCAEPSTDLLQKLQSLSLELKTLKYKEESLGAKTTDVDKSFDHATVFENKHGNSQFVNPMVVKGQLEDNQTVVHDDQFVKPMVVVGQPENNQAVVCDSQSHGNSFIHTTSNDDLMRWKDMSSSKTIHQGVKDLDIKAFSDGSLENHLECDIPTLVTSENLQGLSVPVTGSSSAGVNDPAVDVIGSQSASLDLVRNEVLHLENLIASSESQLLKQSVRREFLGCDSFSRFYWVLAGTGTYPSVISKRNMELKKSGTIVSFGFLDSLSVLRADAFCGVASKSSSAIYALGDENVRSTCVSYKSDAEIKNLVDCLQDNNPTERELKESILRWRKLIFQGSKQSTSQHSEGPQLASPSSREFEISFPCRCLNTMATNLLESKHDTYFEAEMTDFTKGQLRKGKGSAEGNFCRCECLELIWQSRHHCLSCHRTFLNFVELDGHSDGKCNLAAPVLEKIKESNDTSNGKKVMQSEIGQVRCRDEIYAVDASSNGLSRLPSKLIRHQNDGSVCPFDYEDICSKFVIKDSNKELVKEIGLIGSNGIPTFVPSISPYLSDSTLMLVPLQKTEGIQNDTPKTGEQISFSLEKMRIGGHDVKDKSAADCYTPPNKFGNIVPEPSLRPLAGKSVYVLQQLKINLLDMDAALPEEALRPSKRNSDRRCAWRKFVKSAERIYEMVQATIAFEDMINSQYLKNSWWYWSSLSAAAKISTLSSLALRIYSLDAAINYDKSSSHDALLPIGKDDQKQQSSSDQSEKCKLGRKSNKKRKERES